MGSCTWYCCLVEEEFQNGLIKDADNFIKESMYNSGCASENFSSILKFYQNEVRARKAALKSNTFVNENRLIPEEIEKQLSLYDDHLRYWKNRKESSELYFHYEIFLFIYYKWMNSFEFDKENTIKLGERIIKDLKNGKGVCISAHGNSLRALCKYLFKINEREISKMEIPTANPLLIIFEDKLQISSVTYLDQERAKNLVAF